MDRGVQTLPIELIIAIMAEAPPQPDNIQAPCYKWLRACSLVCRSWRAEAQRLLFTRVKVVGSTKRQAFRDALKSPTADAPHLLFLRGSVRSLSILMGNEDVHSDIINLCPALRELHVSIHVDGFTPDIMAAFQRTQQIEVLCVRPQYYKPLLQLLTVLEGLKCLEVDCYYAKQTAKDALIPALQKLPPPKWNLHQLRIQALFEKRSSHNFIAWALSGPSSRTLRILECQYTSYSATTLAPYLRESGIGARLLSLQTPRLGDEDLSALVPSLRELIVGSDPIFPHSIRRFPQGLVHLSLFKLDEDHLPQCLAELASFHERSGGSLRVITYNIYRDEDPPVENAARAAARALYKFCQTRGIDFWLFLPYHGYYSGERIPLGPAPPFPRPMPVSPDRARHDASHRLKTFIENMNG
ncbi:hypothetical protein C8Q79DRAFT_896812 [Trametes meyenii]|nr:hypothetical protein C8Q79DRAFT_896812 [Trametes meyenii]